jgi:CheY-like chemotaxis protein
VVLLTGAFEPVDQARATEVGCDGVLAKPFEPQLVIGRVKELLATPTQALAHAPRAAAAEARAAGETPSAVAPVAELDDYFDRLDVAFAKLSAAPPAQAPRASGAPGDAPEAAAGSEELMFNSAVEEERPPSVADEIDRYALRTAPPSDMPLSYAPRQTDVEPAHATIPAEAAPSPANVPIPAEVPIAAVPPIAAAPEIAAAEPSGSLEPQSPEPREASLSGPAHAPGHPLPSIAEAFAAILAAEQHEATPDVAPGWPIFQVAPPAPVAPPTIEITDDLIERVASRVLERLSDRVVRETTGEIITGVADRLVREEIERIKAAIR